MTHNESQPTVWKHDTSFIFYQSRCFYFACGACSLTLPTRHILRGGEELVPRLGEAETLPDSVGGKSKRKIQLSSMLPWPPSGTDRCQVFLEINLCSGVDFEGGRKHFQLWKKEKKALSRVRLLWPMDCSLPGSSVQGIFQAVLEWVAISFSKGSSQFSFLIFSLDPLLSLNDSSAKVIQAQETIEGLEIQICSPL